MESINFVNIMQEEKNILLWSCPNDYVYVTAYPLCVYIKLTQHEQKSTRMTYVPNADLYQFEYRLGL